MALPTADCHLGAYAMSLSASGGPCVCVFVKTLDIERAARMVADAGPTRPLFDVVYKAEYEALLRLSLALTGDRATAEDLVQDAFLRLHQRWSYVSHYERPGAWLRRVLINLATSRARRIATEARSLARLGRERPGEAGLSSEAAEFWCVVRALPRRQAQTLALFYAEDRSVAEVAEILGCAEGTVRASLHQGRQQLARRLEIIEEDL